MFLYDEATAGLAASRATRRARVPRCLCRHEAKERPLVEKVGTWTGRQLAASIPGWTVPEESVSGYAMTYQSRVLSDQGRVFFDSADALVPQDTNGREDVYEYEPQGVGSCARAGGCVSLISSGTSSEESVFLDASETGNDVFFLTRRVSSRGMSIARLTCMTRRCARAPRRASVCRLLRRRARAGMRVRRRPRRSLKFSARRRARRSRAPATSWNRRSPRSNQGPRRARRASSGRRSRRSSSASRQRVRGRPESQATARGGHSYEVSSI